MPLTRHLTRLLLVTALSLVVAVGTTVGAPTPSTAATWAPRSQGSFDPAKDLEQFEARVLLRINEARARHGLPEVRVFQTCVDGHAERWATRIQRTGRMVHRDLGGVISRCRLGWVGENLVSGTGLWPRQAVRAWLQSPPHRAVMLKPRARWAGVGVRVDRNGRTIAVLNLGDRR